MKRIFVFTLLLILGIGICGNLDAQVNVTVGDGTASNGATVAPTPYGTFYKAFRQQYLILASELEDVGGGAGAINSVGFNVQGLNDCSPMPNYTIRMKHTNLSTFSTSFETGEYQTVFTHNSFMPTEGWNIHSFSNPFVWNGTQNIIVEILTDLIPDSWTQNASVFFTPTSFDSSLRFQSDSSDGITGSTGTTSTSRANIRFNMQALEITNPPNPAIMISPADGAQNVLSDVLLRWSSGGGAPAGYKVHFGTTNPPPFVEETIETVYDPTVENDNTYYWQIVPFNAIGDAQDCPIWSFTTAGQHSTIGAGDQLARMPMDFYYKGSLFETIYYSHELGFTSGTITAIAFSNSFASSTTMGKPTQIWLGSTNQNDLVDAWIPSTQMSLVFDGTVDYPAGENTVTIQLQSPYMHTPGNLVMMVKRPLDGSYFSSADNFLCQTGTEMRTRKLQSDTIDYDSTAPPAATAVAQFPKTTFFYSGEELENDLGALTLTGNLTPSVGLESNYVVTIKNNGTFTQDNYQVKLFKTGELELASVNGPSIAPLQTLQVTVPWTPSEAGPVSIWGEVVLAGDEIEQNNRTALLNLAVQPEGVQAVTIGSGDQNGRYPMDFWWRNSLYQTLYFPDELGFVSGTITSLAFYNNFVTNLPNGATKIWLATSNASDLSDGFIPSSQMTLVFDGNVDYPSGQNTITIPLQTPFFHTPGNLLMMVQRPMDTSYYNSSDNFLCQTAGTDRARYAYSDSESYNPASPPAGTLSGIFPKTTIFYSGEQIENDLGALTLTGNLTPSVGLESNYVVTIKNNGSNTQDDYQVKLFKTGDIELASVDGPNIASLQTLQVTVPWTPTEAGAVTIWGEVVLAGDEIEQNNRTSPLNLAVQPEGVQAVTIGEGNETDRMPMDFYWKSSIFETLIYEDELGFVSGTITSLAFYNDFVSNLPNGATKIWLGSSNQTNLTGGWIPSTQLNLVFDGNVDYPSGANTITIPLQTPYFHAPGNLVIMVQRPVDANYYSNSDNFLCQTGTQMRTLKLQSDSVTYDPASPPAATATARFPKVTIYYSGEPIENDLGAMSLTGNQTPSVGAASNYTVTIKNNGSNAQNDYQVKLFREGDILLSSVAGPAIQSLETLQVNVPWTPDAMGQTYLYATVELDGDEIEQNNRTANFNVEVLEAGSTYISIGDGTSYNATTGSPTPYGTWYKSFRQQYLWTAAELLDAGANTGFITAIAFNVQAVNNCSPMPNFTIRIKETNQTALSTDFEAGPYITVWNHDNYLPSEGWNVHALNEMYHWDGDSNLLIDIFGDVIPGGYSQNASVFYTPTAVNTALRAQSDSQNCSESATGTLSPNRANLRLGMILVGMASLGGTVTGPGGAALPEVQVQFANGGHSAVTNSQGQYNIQNIMPGDYSVSFSKHGYQTQTQNISLDEDEDATLNISLETLPMVNVTGTVIASDTQSGIAGASIQLSGYENYSGNTTATGSFNIPNVYANNSYEFTIMAPGYSNHLGTITLGSTNHDVGTITLDEIAYAPHSLQAEVNVTGTAVNLSWTAPDPNATQITESFEAPEFPPTDWSQEITNTGGPNANGVYNSFCRVGTVPLSGSPATPTDGSFQSGLFWDSTHQDEWLITPSFNCPPGGYLKFDSYVFLGSVNEDHYYVKISTDDGNSWTPLWDASAQTGGWNYYASPITVDLENYGGMQVKLAFNAVDGPDQEGLYYVWFIDNIYIGNLRTEHSPVVNIHFQDEELTYRSDSKTDPSPFAASPRHPSRAQHFGLSRNEPSLPQAQQGRQAPQRALMGYKLWRFTPGQESNETAWSSLTPEILDEPLFTDPDWQTLPNAEYRWAVKAIYTNGVSSVASFSNILEKAEEIGLIAGVVRRINNAPIQGATVSVGAVSATTNAAGAYSLILPIGTYDVTCTATGFEPQTANDITVSPNQTTTLNFYLDAVSNEDELIPVAATELLGNYPNPFNPETVISYSLKDATPVRLEIYNSKGQRIRVLVDETQASGWYRALWNGRDDNGKPVSSGVYVYRMNAGSYSASRKMVLLQ